MKCPAISHAQEFASNILTRTKPKSKIFFTPASNSPALHERTGIARRLSAPVEPDGRDLLSYRLDGEQLLGHSAHHARSGFCRATAGVRRAAHRSRIQRRFLHRGSRRARGVSTAA